jgi:hypothetical protein
MTLSRLISILQRVMGSGCPAVLQTPDGKEWVPSGMVSSVYFAKEPPNDTIHTTVHLVEVKK